MRGRVPIEELQAIVLTIACNYIGAQIGEQTITHGYLIYFSLTGSEIGK